ncbi:tellurite resistance TerB family protein [Nocardia yunnanensis]|nr:TerB family tellurite resistance protein [Nocardia yunnanensis]
MAFSNRLVSPAAPHRDSTAAPAAPEAWGESFRDAAVALCAALSALDGRIDPAARMRVAQMVGAHEVLGRLSTDELRNLFEDNCARLIMDPAFGHAYAMAQIAKATGRPDQARAVIRIGQTVGRIDGILDAHAVTVIREACQVLHLDPHEFGL